MAAILAQCGVYVDDLASVVSEPPRPWYLLPEDLPIWRVWMTVQTQWRTAGMTGIRTGLDYTAVLAVIDRTMRRGRRFAFAAICEMEAAVLDHWSKQQA